MNNVINSWDNKRVFEKQLELNLKELNNYPEHWYDFISLLDNCKPKTLLDVGCGCGTYYKLSQKHFTKMIYTGIDYSEYAIELAKRHWDYNNFYVMNYLELTKDYVNKFDLLHFGALFDVLSNADDAIEFIFKLSPRNIIIGRMKLTNKESYYNIYKAYDEIETYEFFHNYDNFKNLCEKYNYKIYKLKNNFLLTYDVRKMDE